MILILIFVIVDLVQILFPILDHRFTSQSQEQKFAYKCCVTDCNTDNLKTARFTVSFFNDQCKILVQGFQPAHGEARGQPAVRAGQQGLPALLQAEDRAQEPVPQRGGEGQPQGEPLQVLPLRRLKTLGQKVFRPS